MRETVPALLLDEMVGRSLEQHLVTVGHRLGQDEVVVLRVNDYSVLPRALLVNDFQILRFARQHGFVLLTCNIRDVEDRFQAIHAAYQQLGLSHTGILCFPQSEVQTDPSRYNVACRIMEWLHSAPDIADQCLFLRPVAGAFERPMPFRGTAEELSQTIAQVEREEARPYFNRDPLLHYTAEDWRKLTIGYRF